MAEKRVGFVLLWLPKESRMSCKAKEPEGRSRYLFVLYFAIKCLGSAALVHRGIID